MAMPWIAGAFGEPVTRGKAALGEPLRSPGGERIAAPEAIGEGKAKARASAAAGFRDVQGGPEGGAGRAQERESLAEPWSAARDPGV